MEHELLQRLTLIDTPGILAGQKQTLGRQYDFVRVCRWFAERSDMILLLFDAHKARLTSHVAPPSVTRVVHDDKVRLVLNKADQISTEELMHVYGGVMWFLGKVLHTPEVKRSYVSSFWDAELQNEELSRFLTGERDKLLRDLHDLPKGALSRRLNEFIKRVRTLRALATAMAVHGWLSGLTNSSPLTRPPGEDGQDSLAHPGAPTGRGANVWARESPGAHHRKFGGRVPADRADEECVAVRLPQPLNLPGEAEDRAVRLWQVPEGRALCVGDVHGGTGARPSAAHVLVRYGNGNGQGLGPLARLRLAPGLPCEAERDQSREMAKALLRLRASRTVLPVIDEPLSARGWTSVPTVQASDGTLKYFRKQGDVKPSGEIALAQSSIKAAPAFEDKSFTFVIETLGRSYVLQAESAKDMCEWLEVLGPMCCSPEELQTLRAVEEENRRVEAAASTA
eukprot:scaffold5182_cov376-Prasinococcus_capsulatus_cf.AAC.3